MARRPAFCGGYIQSVKWSASKSPSQRSAGGHPARDQAVRQACAPMNVLSLSSSAIPCEHLGDRPAPGRRRGREGDDPVPCFLGRLGEPPQGTEDVVVHARPLVGEWRDVEGDPHGL